MKFYDVFNGDADGLCALVQLRLADPRQATLVTGVKRDIRLLERVHARSGDDIVVLDVSLKANRAALIRSLENGATISWFDHHQPGAIPVHSALRAYIDTDPQICSSLIVDHYLGGRFRAWAIVAAFGDNLIGPAEQAAHALGMSPGETDALRELGTCLNYNAYGESIEDLMYSPADLYQTMRTYAHPKKFINDTDVFPSLQRGMRDDLGRSDGISVNPIVPGAAYAVLPDARWSRRVVGIYANRLAQRDPDTAHAVLVEKQGGFMVSIRAPTTRPRGASQVAAEFQSGGGREGAAGIDFLPAQDFDRLLKVMRTAFGGA